MCFHGNQDPSSIKHPFISLYSKYHPFMFICLLNMNSPVFPSLDDIYCNLSIQVMMCLMPIHVSNSAPNIKMRPAPTPSYLSFCLSVTQSVCLSVCLSVCYYLSFCSSFGLSFSILVCLSVLVRQSLCMFLATF